MKRVGPGGSSEAMRGVPSNNALQLTKAARCAPVAIRWRGQSLRAAFAAERGCCTGSWLVALAGSK